MAGDERESGLHLGVVVVADLLKEKVRVGAGECMGRGFGLDYRLYVAVFGMETTKKIENLAGLGDGVVDVAQIVSEAFELGAVLADGHVALLDAA